jgi:hypothetical protein
VPPHAVLAPGTALGLLRQQGPTLRPGRWHCSRQDESAESDKRERREKGPRCGPVVRSELPCAACDPSRRGQLEISPGCGGLGQPWSRPAARRVGWSGPGGEEFALDKSASAEAEGPAELLTAIVGGTSRRNVLGAIASKRTMATSRSEATTTESEHDDQTTVRAQESPRPTNPRNKRHPPGAIVTKPPRGKPLLLDKLFQERPDRPPVAAAFGIRAMLIAGSLAPPQVEHEDR